MTSWQPPAATAALPSPTSTRRFPATTSTTNAVLPSTAADSAQNTSTPLPDRLLGGAAARSLFEKALYNSGPARYHPQHAIPRFFFPGAADQAVAGETPASLLREAARERHLARHGAAVPDNVELRRLWECLTAAAEAPHNSGATSADMPAPTDASANSAWLTYAQFQSCGRTMAAETDKFAAFFRPSVFFRLRRDAQQRISAHQLLNLVMRKVSVTQIRLSFCHYDAAGDGHVLERDLEQFVLDHITSMPRLGQLHQSFFTTYAVYATRKFMFFLDPQRTGKIRITTLLASDVLNEFNELLEHDLHQALEESNWFSLASVTRVHAAFVALDADANGLLSAEEFAGVDGGGLTAAAVARVFQTSRNCDHQLDYKAYLDYVLATEYSLRRPSLKYLFRLLDADQQGYLSSPTLHFLWRSMLEHPQMADVADAPPIEDIRDEIFDIVKPKDPYRITYNDLEASGQGDVIAKMLLNVNGFFAYEAREGSVPES